MTKRTHSTIILKEVLITLSCLIAANLTANPESQALDPAHWEIKNGNESQAVKSDGKIHIQAKPNNGVELLYDYFPIREKKRERPAWGLFSAKLDLQSVPPGNELTFAVVTPDFQYQWAIHYRPGEPVGLSSMVAGVASELDLGQAILPALDSSAILEWGWNGSELVASIHLDGHTKTLAKWNGELPSYFYFAITATATTDTDPIIIGGLDIKRIRPDVGQHTILRRPGKALPGDENLPEELALLGGDFHGGYLWSPDDEAELPVEIRNLTDERKAYWLVSRVRDLNNDLIDKKSTAVEVGPSSKQKLTLSLPNERFGFFTVETRLYNVDGRVLDTPLYTDYAITTALDPKDLPDSSSFGVHAFAFANLGAKWVRYWDNQSPLLWSKLEPNRGDWQWDKADAFISRTLASGMKPLVVLAATPEWASSDTSYKNYLGRGSYSPPENIEDWSRYCREVAKRYKGKVEYYEIWNEPNYNGLADRGYFFYGTAEDYLELLIAAHAAIKEVDPNAKILAPSGTGNFPPFLERILSLGGAEYFDILSIHTYTTPLSPASSYEKRVHGAYREMEKAGIDKPVWNTEVGFFDVPDRGGQRLSQQDIAEEADPEMWPNWWSSWPIRPVDKRRSAGFRVRFLLLGPTLGVDKTFYHHRLIHHPDGEPYISAPALAWANRILAGSQYDKVYSWHPQSRAVGYHLADGRYLLAVWRVEDEVLRLTDKEGREVQTIDVAPLIGADERELVLVDTDDDGQTASNHKIRTYFSPDRRVPRWLVLPEATGGFDFFGNPIEPSEKWHLEECPVYIVLDSKPSEDFAVKVREGVAPDEVRATGYFVPPTGNWSYEVRRESEH